MTLPSYNYGVLMEQFTGKERDAETGLDSLWRGAALGGAGQSAKTFSKGK